MPDLPQGPLDPIFPGDVTSRSYITVPTTSLYQDPLYGKPRGVRVDQGTTAWLKVPFFSSETGGPLVIDVGLYTSPPIVEARYKEASGYKNTVINADAELSDEGDLARVEIPDELADFPGIYTLQISVRFSTAHELMRNQCWVICERGMWLTDGTAPTDDRGPPTFAEVRTAIRDHPGANRLLGDYAADEAEVAQSLVAAVQAFNNEFPIGPRGATTINFPSGWRRPWIDGALAYLFETFAEYHRRGRLPYQAGGTSIDDLSKSPEYEKAADFYRQRFARWCRIQKARSSYAAGWGSLGSGCPGGATY